MKQEGWKKVETRTREAALATSGKGSLFLKEEGITELKAVEPWACIYFFPDSIYGDINYW